MIPTLPNRSSNRLAGAALAALWLAALAALPAAAQPLANALIDFEPVDYILELDGAKVDSEVLQSRAAGAFLVLSPQLESPVLLRLRQTRVETVQLLKVDRQADGTVDLLPDPTDQVLGMFRVTKGGDGVAFSVGNREVLVKQKPPLLGRHDTAGMATENPGYVRTAAAYYPSEPILDKLRAQTRDVKVEIYFGTWCPYCTQMVPRMMKVAEGLNGSKIQIEYYGLPRDVKSDPIAEKMDIHAVPTGVVYVGGEEVGRISGQSWKIPELALNRLLVESSS